MAGGYNINTPFNYKTMKSTVLLLAFFLVSVSGFSQKVKFKKGVILADDKELLLYERGGTLDASTYELSEINSKKRIILLVQNENGTHMDLNDDYTQIKFLTIGQKAEIRGGDLREAIKILLKNEVLRADGTLDESKIELFIKNYDEKISARTILRG